MRLLPRGGGLPRGCRGRLRCLGRLRRRWGRWGRRGELRQRGCRRLRRRCVRPVRGRRGHGGGLRSERCDGHGRLLRRRRAGQYVVLLVLLVAWLADRMARGCVEATTDHALSPSFSQVRAPLKTRVTELMASLRGLAARDTGPARFTFVAAPLPPEEEASGAKGVLGLLLDSAATFTAKGRSPRPAPGYEHACTRRAMVRSALPARPPTPTAPSARNSAVVFFVLFLGADRAPRTGPPFF